MNSNSGRSMWRRQALFGLTMYAIKYNDPTLNSDRQLGTAEIFNTFPTAEWQWGQRTLLTVVKVPRHIQLSVQVQVSLAVLTAGTGPGIASLFALLKPHCFYVSVFS